MDSENVFDIYNAPEAPEAPSSKRHPGESSKVPQAKKTRTAGPPADGPSANVTPPSSPLEQQTPPAPVESTPSPPTPTNQTQQATPASTGGDISSRALKSVKERVAKILKHDRCREAMLTLTTGRLRSGAVTEQFKTLEQRHIEERKAANAKYAEQLEALLGEKNKLAEELKEKQNALYKAVEQRDNFKEPNRKHNQEADFSYLPERARHAEIARYVARLAEEERARVVM
ncbi:uncharacterized protein LOC133799755 [Humulus lupulus]|uniref:uncharacterized protein LOC133799755 n=1 Tax=Humulus lupulus TaxID=3486 RepID=UPI002B40B31C|nr:uncharacterized protein LOC133799755 [Humulus lupulus]